MKKITFVLSILLNFVLSQVSIESIPKSFLSDRVFNQEEIILPAINIEELLEEDRLEMESNEMKPYRFAKTIDVELNMENSGSWTTLEDGSLIWQLKIVSPGAYSLNLIYDIYNLPPGAELFLYSDETILGAFTDFNHKPHGGFSTAPTQGASVILEYNEPANSIFNGQISIASVAHDYKNIFLKNSVRGYGDSGSCNNNANCPVGEDWQDEIRSVAMILTSGGSRLCTGSLINNTEQDLRPLFLTANHCLGGNNSWIFMFNYESPGCTNQDGPTNMTVSGSTLLANSGNSDFALLELNEEPPDSYNVHFSGWDVTGNTPNTPVCIHHPSGDIKKITFDYDNASNAGNYWDVNQWEDGTTEPGSSGSPLFDGISHRIVGQLYGGTASCTSITYDTYGKTSTSWGLGLSQYLDPQNTGLQILDGTSTGGGITILHDNLDDMPFTNNSINISANIASNSGNIESAELYYDIGEGFVNQEMQLGFGNNYQASIDGLNNGMIIKYYLQAVNSEGEIALYPTNAPENPILFILGDLPDLYSNNFETGASDWTIGDSSDTATAGLWELAEPLASYNDQGNQVQTGEDNTVDGTYCFVTGNGYEVDPETNQNSASFDDVDGGVTTLYSPEFNFDGLDEVILTYSRWYTNNVGDNGDTDKWIVSVTNNGNIWVNLENTTSSSTDWEKKRFILSDYIDLTGTLQFKFAAEDIFYNGDDGTGGSLVEAAIDDFTIEYIAENSSIIGDINNDGNVNIQDVVILVSIILGDEPQNFSADLNNDNSINVQDVIFLISLIISD